MNIQQLEYIVAVDQHKNFSKAAEHCFVTQATLSTMVKKLEQELNLILFDRKTNPIITTDCGKDIITEAKKVLYHFQQVQEVSKTIQNKITGKVIIGIIPTIAGSLLPIILQPILNKYSDLELNIIELTTENIIDQLKTGQIDIGIAATPLKNTEIEESILYYEALMVYGEIDQDKTYKISDDLKDKDIWLLEEGHCFRDQALKLCELKENKMAPHNLKFHANSFDTLLNMVDSFGGLTLIPELFYKTLPEERKHKVSMFKKPIPVREISLIYYRQFAKSRIINALEKEIKAILQGNLVSERYKNSELTILNI